MTIDPAAIDTDDGDGNGDGDAAAVTPEEAIAAPPEVPVGDHSRAPPLVDVNDAFVGPPGDDASGSD